MVRKSSFAGTACWPVIALLIAFGAFCATVAGGAIALRLKDRLHLVLGFSAGAVVGLALLDLIPEAMELGRQSGATETLPLWLALGFIAYMLLDRLAPLHQLPAAGGKLPANPLRGALGAGSLSLHSLLDGFAIGLALHVSTPVGLVVTCGVLTHDFSDGVNTMNMILKNGGSRARGLRWLLIDALAPALGIGLSYILVVPERMLGPFFMLFAGFFLYIGASELVPESYHAHPKSLTTVMTLLGMAVIYAAVQLAR